MAYIICSLMFYYVCYIWSSTQTGSISLHCCIQLSHDQHYVLGTHFLIAPVCIDRLWLDLLMKILQFVFSEFGFISVHKIATIAMSACWQHAVNALPYIWHNETQTAANINLCVDQYTRSQKAPNVHTHKGRIMHGI